MRTRKRGAIRIGGGSGFSNDRLDATLELVERGDIDVLMLETLAERTLALLQVARRKGGSGYWDNLAGRLHVLLPAMAQHGTKFITNAGGAAPEACARMIARLARERGIDMKVAAGGGGGGGGMGGGPRAARGGGGGAVSLVGAGILFPHPALGA